MHKVEDSLNEQQVSISSLDSSAALNRIKVTRLEGSVGEEPIGAMRNVHQDLLYIKTTIGNDPNKTIDGVVSEGLPSSGIKSVLISLAEQALKNKDDIADIKDSIAFIKKSLKDLEDLVTGLIK